MNNILNDYFAIVIGMNSYGTSSLTPLSSAKKDASDLYGFLTDIGGYKLENTCILTDENASKENIIKSLDEFKTRFTTKSTLLFYFSGHGGNYNNSYVLPLYNYDYTDTSTFFTADELTDLFSEINASKLLFMFDTCYSGVLAREKGKSGFDIEQKLNTEFAFDKLVKTSVSNSRVLIASSLPDQTSYEIKNEHMNNGIFTHCLLKALHGACQIEKSSKIYIFDLLRYLIRNVSAISSQNKIKQHCCVKTSVLYQDFEVCYTSESVDYVTQLPKRYINAVIDLQEDSNALLEQFAYGLSKRTVDSKFTYWGQEVTKQYIELLNTNEYNMPRVTSELISSNIASIIKRMKIGSKGIRVISLGIGDGYKDAIILNKLCDLVNSPIDYWIIEFSYEMLKTGLKNVREKLGETNYNRIVPRLFQTDFLDVDILSDLLTDDKTNLFLLLGNTLGNFPEGTLLNKISSVMHQGDFFLIDNQIKSERKLTKSEEQILLKMYNTNKYKDYIFSILKNAHINRSDGEIHTRVTDYNDASNAVLREYKCATVLQEFTFSVDKEVNVGGQKIPFDKGTIIPVIYSRKYTKSALNSLLSNYFSIVNQFYKKTEYALILCQKPIIN